MPKTNKQLFTSNKDNWRTPKTFWDTLNKRYNFWIDLAADNSNAKCQFFLTKEDNSLSKNWTQLQKLYEPETLNKYAWCNPPYGTETKKFLQKASEENLLGFRSVFLVAGRTDTYAFNNYIFGQAGKVFFIEGRLTFDDENGIQASATATFPSLVVVYSGQQEETKFFRMDKFGNI